MADSVFRTGKTDRPHCDLREGEVEIVVGALRAKAQRIETARNRLQARGANAAAFTMTNALTACVKLLQGLEKDFSHGTLRNRDEINLASDAVCDRVVEIIRSGDVRDVRLHVIRELLDRIRIGWKRIPAIPAEVLAEIHRREDRRFWAPLGQTTVDPYAWLEVETPVAYEWVA